MQQPIRTSRRMGIVVASEESCEVSEEWHGFKNIIFTFAIDLQRCGFGYLALVRQSCRHPWNLSPSHNGGTPRQTSTKTGAGNDIPLLYLSRLDCLAQSYGDGPRTGVSVASEICNDFFFGDFQPLGDNVHNSNVCLVKEQPIDIIGSHVGLLEGLRYDSGDFTCGEFVYLLAIHGEIVVAGVF